MVMPHTRTAERKRRLSTLGPYGGLSLAAVTRMVGSTSTSRFKVERCLRAFFQHPERIGQEGNPALVGLFIRDYLNDEEFDLVSVRQFLATEKQP